jgi:hypothetical protein
LFGDETFFADFFAARATGDELDIFPKPGARFDMLREWKTDLWGMWAGRRAGWGIF